MNATADRLVDDYLRRLRIELKDIPRDRRRELLDEIEGHIVEARAELGNGGTEVREVLDRLGEPGEIAAEGRRRFGLRRLKPGLMEIGALILLPLGGFVGPIVGWFVGVALLWASAAWSLRDKLIGTLLFPGGLALSFYVWVFQPLTAEACTSVPAPPGSSLLEIENCSGGPSDWNWVLAVVVALVPILTTIYLGVRLRRACATENDD